MGDLLGHVFDSQDTHSFLISGTVYERLGGRTFMLLHLQVTDHSGGRNGRIGDGD